MPTNDGSRRLSADEAAQAPPTLGATVSVGKEGVTEVVVEEELVAAVASSAIPLSLSVEMVLSVGALREVRVSTVRWRRMRTNQRRRRNVKSFGRRCVANTVFYGYALHILACLVG
jgi:hypothetical protein